MIQRIQSIWLFLAFLTLALLLALPILTKEVSGTISTITTRGLYQRTGANGPNIETDLFLPLMISNIAVAVMCFVNIFNFRRRSFQKRIAVANIALIGGFAFWCSVFAKKIPGGLEGAHFSIGAYLPALAILFIVFAIFGINKDERLIRSAERLR